MSTGSKSGSIDEFQSGQQEQMFNLIAPTLANLFGAEYTPGTEAVYGEPEMIGESDEGRPQYGRPPVTSPATAGGFTSTGQAWQPPAGLSPTADWYNNLSPEYMEGLWSPVQDAANQYTEFMGGGAGSASGGWSGQAASGLGDLYARAGTQIGQQAWNMGADQRQAMMLPYTGALAALSGTYPEAVVQPPGMDPFTMLMGGGMTAGSLGWAPLA